jgi:glyoxylase-like metal-dependent hydrolase (beta-lactamase superfamily II)
MRRNAPDAVAPGRSSLVFRTTGLVKDAFYTLGLTWSPVYLLDGKKPVLFESGFACAGRIYAEAIRSVLRGRHPEMLFLTHVHWDHCGAAGYLKECFPGISLGASLRAAEIIKRPHARELIGALSEQVVPLVAGLPGIDQGALLHGAFGHGAFRPFEVDTVLRDGQVMELDKGISLEVLATPGHTRDLLSYYVPEKRILIATEACGCLDQTGTFITQFLVDYDEYLASLRRLAALPAEVLCQGHHFVFVGRAEVRRFFSRSIRETERFRDHVGELLRTAGGSVEETVRLIKAEQWDANTATKQAEAAYLLNLRTQVALLARKAKKGAADEERPGEGGAAESGLVPGDGPPLSPRTPPRRRSR